MRRGSPLLLPALVVALVSVTVSCGGDDGGGGTDTAASTTFPLDQLPVAEGPAEADLAALAVFDDEPDAVLGPVTEGSCAEDAAASAGELLAPAGEPITVTPEGAILRLDLDGGLTWLVTPPGGGGAPEEPFLVQSVIGGSVVVGFERETGERIVARLDAGGLDQAVLVPAPVGEVDSACPDIAVGAQGVLAIVPGDDGTPQLARWDWRI